jgi:hypothetical protein
MTGKTALTAWSGTTGKLKLQNSTGSETADGTEISGGSYPAGGIVYTVSSTFGASSYSTGVTSATNSGAAITQTSMPTVGSPGVTYATIYDNGGIRWWWGALTTPVLTNSGDTLTFATSSITVQLNM